MKMHSVIAVVFMVAAVVFAVAMFNPPPTRLSHWIIGVVPIAILLAAAYKLQFGKVS